LRIYTILCCLHLCTVYIDYPCPMVYYMSWTEGSEARGVKAAVSRRCVTVVHTVGGEWAELCDVRAGLSHRDVANTFRRWVAPEHVVYPAALWWGTAGGLSSGGGRRETRLAWVSRVATRLVTSSETAGGVWYLRHRVGRIRGFRFVRLHRRKGGGG